MTGYVYMLTAPTGEKYIGQTTNIKRRMKQYVYKSRADISPIYRAVNKYGFQNFNKQILETVEGTKDEVVHQLNALEAMYIEKYDTVNSGLNVYRFDSRTHELKMSIETRKQMSESHRGTKQSEESRQKRSGENAYQGKCVRSAMLGMTFPTLKAAANYVGVNGGCKISECINGLRRSVGTDPVSGKRVNDWEYV